MNLRYLLVDVDGGGSFGTQSYEHIRSLVGPEGWARVGLHPATGMAGFVNDIGLTRPDLYPRNVVGSVLLGSLAANQRPYAGPVVIIGWDHEAQRRDEFEVCGLDKNQADHLDLLLTNIRIVLGYQWGEPTLKDPDWERDVKGFAQYVKTCLAPTVELVGDVDVLLSMLREGGGGR